MSFVQSFDQFNTKLVKEDALAEKTKIRQKSPNEGESGRWEVVRKSSNATGTAVPYKELAQELAGWPDFQKWWSSQDPKSDSKFFQMICFVDSDLREAGFLKRDKVTATFIFKPYGSMQGGQGYMAMYDVKSAQPVVIDMQVGTSIYTLTAWDIKNEPTLRTHSSDGKSGTLAWRKGDQIPVTGYMIGPQNDANGNLVVYTPGKVYKGEVGYAQQLVVPAPTQQAPAQPAAPTTAPTAAPTVAPAAAPTTGGAKPKVSPNKKNFIFKTV